MSLSDTLKQLVALGVELGDIGKSFALSCGIFVDDVVKFNEVFWQN